MPGQERNVTVVVGRLDEVPKVLTGAAGGGGLVDGTNCNDRFNDI